MTRAWRNCFQGIIIVAALMLLLTGTAKAQLTIRDVQTTDVTPSGFSVVWLTSEPAAPLVMVYSDAAGLNDITSQLEITPYPLQGGDPAIIEAYYSEEDMEALRGISHALGIIKVGIHGCLPDTEYFFKVGAANGGGGVWWPETDLYRVKTAVSNTFVADSKQVLVTLVNNAGDPPADGWANGWVVMAYSPGLTPYPVGSFVGDGAGPNQAYLNLSHFFGQDGFNWTPAGTWVVILEILGYSEEPVIHILSLDFTDEFHVTTLYPLEINVDTTYIFPKGNINCDEETNLVDAILSLQILSGTKPPTNICKEGDVNNDGIIAFEEVIYILQYVSGLRR